MKQTTPSKYAVTITEEEKHTSSNQLDQSNTNDSIKQLSPKCCARIRLWWRMLSANRKIQEERRLSKLSPIEQLIEEKLKEKNFLVQQLYDVNKEARDPGIVYHQFHSGHVTCSTLQHFLLFYSSATLL